LSCPGSLCPDRHSHTSLTMVICIWSSAYDLSGSLQIFLLKSSIFNNIISTLFIKFRQLSPCILFPSVSLLPFILWFILKSHSWYVDHSNIFSMIHLMELQVWDCNCGSRNHLFLIYIFYWSYQSYIQGLMLPREVPYHLSHSTSTILCWILLRYLLMNYVISASWVCRVTWVSQ
jgi:hypothetical protein